jgi:hypothetical protein
MREKVFSHTNEGEKMERRGRTFFRAVATHLFAAQVANDVDVSPVPLLLAA